MRQACFSFPYVGLSADMLFWLAPGWGFLLPLPTCPFFPFFLSAFLHYFTFLVLVLSLHLFVCLSLAVLCAPPSLLGSFFLFFLCFSLIFLCFSFPLPSTTAMPIFSFPFSSPLPSSPFPTVLRKGGRKKG